MCTMWPKNGGDFIKMGTILKSTESKHCESKRKVYLQIDQTQKITENWMFTIYPRQTEECI